ncbi:nuclear transport factor 2 family protein [Endothiovibrio diazotrophicus]
MSNYLQKCGAVLLASAVLSASPLAAQASQTRQEKTVSTNKQKVVDLLKSIETGDAAPVAYINPDRYIQHNLAVGDGLAGFGKVLQQLPEGSAKANTVRVFEDGPYVFAQTDYNFFGPKVGFDIFRFEDGRIVEHWDNLQDKPTDPNPSGHTMLDGQQVVDDRGDTAANKALVKNFVEDVLVHGHLDKLPNYFDGDHYIQHNPQIGDGLSGLDAALKALAKQGIDMKYTKVHKVLGEGNFVLVASEGDFGGTHTSFYDLFRVQNGKIAEHWDTLQTIPPRAEWKNGNGKY